MKRAFILILLSGMLVSCSGGKTETNIDVNDTVETDKQTSVDDDHEKFMDSVESFLKNDMPYEKATNLTDEDKAKIKEIENDITEKIESYNKGNIMSSFFLSVDGGASIKTDSELYFDSHDSDSKYIDGNEFINPRTSIELKEVFKDKDGFFRIILNVKYPQIDSAGLVGVKNLLETKEVNESFRVIEDVLITNASKNLDNLNILDRYFMLTYTKVGSKDKIYSADYQFFKALTGNIDTFTDYRVAKLEPTVRAELERKFVEGIKLISNGDFEGYKDLNERKSTMYDVSNPRYSTRMELTKAFAKNCTVTVYSGEIGDLYTSSSGDYRDIKILYGVKMPDINDYFLRKAVEGKGNDEIRAELLEDLKNDKVPYITSVIESKYNLYGEYKNIKLPKDFDNLLENLGGLDSKWAY